MYIHSCDMAHKFNVTHAYVRHGSFMFVTSAGHDTSICVTCLLHMPDGNHLRAKPHF